MCCAIAAMLLALFPAWTGGREAVLRWLAHARGVAIASAVALVAVAGTAFAAGRTAPSPWMAHICSFMNPTDQPARR
jgi:hypothetical protein